MPKTELLTGPEAITTDYEQYEAQGRLNRLMFMLEVNPFAVGTTDEICEQSEDGLYVSPDIFTRNDELPKFTEMHLLPGAFVGAGDSDHGVMFAQVQVTDGKENDWVDVAIKPYSDPDGLEAAVHEHDSLLEIKDKGLDTLDSLAIFKDGDSSYLITEFRPDILSMDNVDWTIPPEDEKRFEEEVVGSLAMIAGNLGEMQGKGIFRDDVLPKNFAKTDSGTPVVIDIERDSIVTDDPEEHVRLLRSEDASQEWNAIIGIQNFWYFLTQPTEVNPNNVLLRGAEPEVICQLAKEVFMPAWKKSLMQHMPKNVALYIDVEEIERKAISAIEKSLRY